MYDSAPSAIRHFAFEMLSSTNIKAVAALLTAGPFMP